ncbi:MAG: VWA domain-containing protein [Acidobacteriota bacterium]
MLALSGVLLILCAANTFGQSRCFSDDESRKVIESIKSPTLTSENKKLRRELVEMAEKHLKLSAKIALDVEKNKELISVSDQTAEKDMLRVCQMIKENGWLTKDALKEEGFNALTFIIANNRAFGLQREMLPALTEAAKKDYIGYPLLASLVDNIRTGYRLPQIFGTQAIITDNVIYILPLLNDEKVDEWRKEYKMAPLAVWIRQLEESNLLPVLKTQRPSVSKTSVGIRSENNADQAVLGISNDDSDTVKVETKLVNLNVRVLTKDSKVPTGLSLSKDDFTILEDGVEQPVSFFTTTDEPFDLVLVLDFSGSTTEKRGLIKKAAERFVEYARPRDRIAVVAFANEIKMVSDLTANKESLTKSIKDIKLDGGSPIWESLKFTYDNIIKKESVGRRSAVVFMTDGVDWAKSTTFADVMEVVRHGDTTIFSVYLNTTGNIGSADSWTGRYIRKSQLCLSMLADESGGQFYKAGDIKDLNGIYEQVINDLGKVFSVGYEPKNEVRDGGWRNLTVKIKTQPTLAAKTRRGYYAN